MSNRGDYRVGVVGLGGQGLNLARWWSLVDGARLVAVADLLPERLDRARSELGDVECYSSHLDMLQQGNVDIVTIGTAANAHASVTIDAAQRRVRGVFVEKPMAQTLADCDAMIAACQASGTVLVVGHQRRWNPAVRSIRYAIKEGAIGRPTNAYFTKATGRVGTEGTHIWDATNYMLDDEVEWVRGIFDRTQTSQHRVFGPEMVSDPGVVGVVKYRSGTRLTVDMFNDVMMPVTWIFCGTRGRIEFREWAGFAGIDYWARDEDNTDPQFGRAALPKRDFPYSDPTEAPSAAEVRGHPRYDNIRALADLVHCVATGDRPASTGEDGRQAVEAIAAFHLSAREDMKQVSLPLQGDEVRRMVLPLR